MMGVYDQPYYEIAFSYQEAKRQMDFFEKVAKSALVYNPPRFHSYCKPF